MLSLRDIHHENYYNEDGSLNTNCILFNGISEENKNKYLQSNLKLGKK